MAFESRVGMEATNLERFMVGPWVELNDNHFTIKVLGHTS
jgi:hypothetical protein